jgi:phage head maturation protease
MSTELQFDGLTMESFSADMERRTITGLLVPWNKIGRHDDGRQWRFARGSLKWADVKYIKFNNDHDHMQWLGRATKVEDTEEGLVVTFKVSPGQAGDRALRLAQSKSKTGLSVEIEMDTADAVRDPDNQGVILVNMAHLTGAGFVSNPAFTDSRLISVRASKSNGEEPAVPDNPIEETAPATQPTPPATPAAPSAAPQQAATATPTPAAAPVSTGQPSDRPAQVVFSEAQFAAFLERFPGPALAEPEADARPTVDPTTREVASTQVTEPLPYRFSHNAGSNVPGTQRYVFHRGEHDFSTDLYGLINRTITGEAADRAERRVNTLVRAAFDVDTTDTSGLTPKVQRPDMWYPQRDYSTPLWDLVNSGTLADGTPFELPKYNSSSGLVSAATEGTEPAPGAFTVTTQTITPTQLWGKVEITRQAIRRGGNPQTSGVIWEQMLRSYFEAREAAVATFLATLTAATDITLTVATGASDATEDRTSVSDLEAALAALQFVRGGNNFTAAAAQQDLFALLARVKDTAGRPLYPMINPQNSDGTKASLYKTIDVGGTTFVPAWALGAGGQTNPTNSWLFDPAVVRGWASQPDRLEWDFGASVQTNNVTQLALVTMGIYGDIALGNIDINGVRQIVHDPVGS